MLCRVAILFSIATVVTAHSGECYGQDCDARSDTVVMLQRKVTTQDVPKKAVPTNLKTLAKHFKQVIAKTKARVKHAMKDAHSAPKSGASKPGVAHVQQPHPDVIINPQLKKILPKSKVKQLKKVIAKAGERSVHAMKDASSAPNSGASKPAVAHAHLPHPEAVIRSGFEKFLPKRTVKHLKEVIAKARGRADHVMKDASSAPKPAAAHAQQLHPEVIINPQLKKILPQSTVKQLKEAMTKAGEQLTKPHPKPEVKQPKEAIAEAGPHRAVADAPQPHPEVIMRDQLKKVLPKSKVKQLKDVIAKVGEQVVHAMKDASSAHHSGVSKPPFSAAKAQRETAHDLKEAVDASRQHWLSNMKLPHQRAIDEQLKHIGAPSDHTAQGPTGSSFKMPTFHIVFGLPHEASATPISYKAAAAEFLAMTLFVVIGCGCAMAICNEKGWVLQVALTFGLAITALAYTVGHFSGGQINCAVTLGLVLAGKVTVAQGLLNFVAQMLGSVTGAFILTQIIPEEQDKTGGLGTNSVNEKLTKLNAFVGEFLMTFLLMFVVLQTAINPETKANREMAAVAIGFAVFLAHSVLINIDGCSINPTRTFGPALVRQLCYKNKAASFEEQWVFWAGPLLGAAGATLVSSLMS